MPAPIPVLLSFLAPAAPRCRKIHAPRILLLDCPLEYKKGENQTNVELMKEEDWWVMCWARWACCAVLCLLLWS